MSGYSAVVNADSDTELTDLEHHLSQNRTVWWRHLQGRLVSLALAAGCLILIIIFVAAVVVTFQSGKTNDVQNSYSFGSSNERYNGPILKTQPCGSVQGVLEDSAYAFKGIPYAKAPIGALRWQKPGPLDSRDGSCWNGVYYAGKYGNQCIQTSSSTEGGIAGDEDCLFLNIFTPTLQPSDKLPVIVWIHGGYLLFGNSSIEGYSPTPRLARLLDVVFVSFNYRLGALGFMALDILSQNSPNNRSGNYGFYDQLSALKWVQENIEHFGGNKNLVTVMGHSSGGTSIFAMLASPLAKGLFHRAWMSSSSSILNKTLESASKDNLIFLKRINCQTIECLLGKTSAEVTNAITYFQNPIWGANDAMGLPTKGVFNGAIAIVDGEFLTAPPLVTWNKEEPLQEQQKSIADVPLIIGTMAQEFDLQPNSSDIEFWNWDTYDAHIAATFTSFGGEIYQRAQELYGHVISPEYTWTTMGSDIRVNCPNDVITRIASETFSYPVYRYVGVGSPSVPVRPFPVVQFDAKYAFHGWDVFAFFNSVELFIEQPSSEDLAFQSNMQDLIVNFAKTGKIKNYKWRTFPSNTGLISHAVRVVDNYHAKKCAFWLRHGFFSYAWIN